ncbi:NADH-quinone oxidoreductase subunit NuoN [Ruania halotolerans]|uniref:NADH-quinone oxidoreductase subunit NuoN n=1 Tax=Ruania halotolerans TaxID=2897773 RepID=UPI001E59B42F|nr:NADH-quinone oxidoreductase subunit NuoN [Ruania halotolerans]UFU05795.1 NADH-quinone oxidoreductase subunit NuoN [Ruania halotolerans]
MNPFIPPSIDWAALSPLIIVLGAAVLGVLIEAFVKDSVRRAVQVSLAVLALGAALVSVAWRWTVVQSQGPAELVGGAMLEDGPALLAQGIVLICAFVGMLVIADRSGGEDAFTPVAAAVPGSAYEAQARRLGLVQTEVYPLVLFSVAGMLVFPAAGDLLTLFIALEVLSLPLYLLVGLSRRRRLLSQEASLKYFLLGAFSSAFFLMGVALLYGYSGSVRFADLAAAVPAMVGMDTVLLAGVVFVLVGLLFKVGAVPFHSWVPDVYQGSPTSITGFMAACTKIAAFAAMVRFVYVVAPGLEWDLSPLLWGIAILTMGVGTVLAIVQTDIKRMLAYSSVAHAGFVLLGVLALTSSGISSVFVYLLVYGLATVGAFALVSMVREKDAEGNITGEATRLSQWAGLGRRHPVLAMCFTLFLLSFAGIPLTAGFIGKFAVFAAAVEGGAWPLVVVAVLASAAAAFFYVRVIVLMFFTDPGEAAAESAEGVETGSAVVAGIPEAAVVKTEGLTAVAVIVCAVGTVVLGVLPTPILSLAAEAAKFIP